MQTIKGTAHRFGDHVDTDQIIPARYLVSTDEKFLGEHCLEVADPDFVKRVRPGDVVVAGVNFGCGSSREHAVLALKGAGVSAVIARSFARIFYRNAINRGLLVLESDQAVEGIQAGDEVEIDLEQGVIRNITRGTEFRFRPLEPFMREILEAGGLVEYTRRRLAGQRG